MANYTRFKCSASIGPGGQIIFGTAATGFTVPPELTRTDISALKSPPYIDNEERLLYRESAYELNMNRHWERAPADRESDAYISSSTMFIPYTLTNSDNTKWESGRYVCGPHASPWRYVSAFHPQTAALTPEQLRPFASAAFLKEYDKGTACLPSDWVFLPGTQGLTFIAGAIDTDVISCTPLPSEPWRKNYDWYRATYGDGKFMEERQTIFSERGTRNHSRPYVYLQNSASARSYPGGTAIGIGALTTKVAVGAIALGTRARASGSGAVTIGRDARVFPSLANTSGLPNAYVVEDRSLHGGSGEPFAHLKQSLETPEQVRLLGMNPGSAKGGDVYAPEDHMSASWSFALRFGSGAAIGDGAQARSDPRVPDFRHLKQRTGSWDVTKGYRPTTLSIFLKKSLLLPDRVRPLQLLTVNGRVEPDDGITPCAVSPDDGKYPLRELFHSYTARDLGPLFHVHMRCVLTKAYLLGRAEHDKKGLEYQALLNAAEIREFVRNEDGSVSPGVGSTDAEKDRIAFLAKEYADESVSLRNRFLCLPENTRSSFGVRSFDTPIPDGVLGIYAGVALGATSLASDGGTAVGVSAAASGPEGISMGVGATGISGIAIGSFSSADVGGIRIGSATAELMSGNLGDFGSSASSSLQSARDIGYGAGSDLGGLPGPYGTDHHRAPIRGRAMNQAPAVAEYGDVLLGNDFVSSVRQETYAPNSPDLRFAAYFRQPRDHQEGHIVAHMQADAAYTPTRPTCWASDPLREILADPYNESQGWARSIPTPFRVSVGDSIINDALLTTTLGGYATATEQATSGSALGFASAVCGERSVAIGAYAVSRHDGEVAIGGSKWSCKRNLSALWQGDAQSSAQFTTDNGKPLTLVSNRGRYAKHESVSMSFIDGHRHNGLVSVTGTISVQPTNAGAGAKDVVILNVKYKLWINDAAGTAEIIGDKLVGEEHRGANAPNCSVDIGADGVPTLTTTSVTRIQARCLLELVDLQSVRPELPDRNRAFEKATHFSRLVTPQQREFDRLSALTTGTAKAVDIKPFEDAVNAEQRRLSENPEYVAASTSLHNMQEAWMLYQRTDEFLPPTAEFTAMDAQRRVDTFGAELEAEKAARVALVVAWDAIASGLNQQIDSFRTLAPVLIAGGVIPDASALAELFSAMYTMIAEESEALAAGPEFGPPPTREMF